MAITAKGAAKYAVKSALGSPDFDEHKHKRDADGKFAKKAGTPNGPTLTVKGNSAKLETPKGAPNLDGAPPWVQANKSKQPPKSFKFYKPGYTPKAKSSITGVNAASDGKALWEMKKAGWFDSDYEFWLAAGKLAAAHKKNHPNGAASQHSIVNMAFHFEMEETGGLNIGAPQAVSAPKKNVHGKTSSGAKLVSKFMAPGQLAPTGKKMPGVNGAMVYKDKDNNNWLVKFPGGSKGTSKAYSNNKFLVNLDVATSRIQNKAGLPVPSIHAKEVDGKIASVHKMFKRANDAFPDNNVVLGMLDDADVVELQKNMVLDWLLSNHDPHSGNFLKTDKGIIGIDKGQSFKYFGKDKLTPNFGSDINPPLHPNKPVYSTIMKQHKEMEEMSPGTGMLKDFNSGEVGTTIQRIMAIDDDEYRDLLRPYATHARKVGLLNYPGKSYSDSDTDAVDKFLDAAVARKNNLDKDFGDLWKQITPSANKPDDDDEKIKPVPGDLTWDDEPGGPPSGALMSSAGLKSGDIINVSNDFGDVMKVKVNSVDPDYGGVQGETLDGDAWSVHPNLFKEGLVTLDKPAGSGKKYAGGPSQIVPGKPDEDLSGQTVKHPMDVMPGDKVTYTTKTGKESNVTVKSVSAQQITIATESGGTITISKAVLDEGAVKFGHVDNTEMPEVEGKGTRQINPSGDNKFEPVENIDHMTDSQKADAIKRLIPQPGDKGKWKSDEYSEPLDFKVAFAYSPSDLVVEIGDDEEPVGIMWDKDQKKWFTNPDSVDDIHSSETYDFPPPKLSHAAFASAYSKEPDTGDKVTVYDQIGGSTEKYVITNVIGPEEIMVMPPNGEPGEDGDEITLQWDGKTWSNPMDADGEQVFQLPSPWVTDKTKLKQQQLLKAAAQSAQDVQLPKTNKSKSVGSQHKPTQSKLMPGDPIESPSQLKVGDQIQMSYDANGYYSLNPGDEEYDTLDKVTIVGEVLGHKDGGVEVSATDQFGVEDIQVMYAGDFIYDADGGDEPSITFLGSVAPEPSAPPEAKTTAPQQSSAASKSDAAVGDSQPPAGYAVTFDTTLKAWKILKPGAEPAKNKSGDIKTWATEEEAMNSSTMAKYKTVAAQQVQSQMSYGQHEASKAKTFKLSQVEAGGVTQDEVDKFNSLKDKIAEGVHTSDDFAQWKSLQTKLTSAVQAAGASQEVKDTSGFAFGHNVNLVGANIPKSDAKVKLSDKPDKNMGFKEVPLFKLKGTAPPALEKSAKGPNAMDLGKQLWDMKRNGAIDSDKKMWAEAKKLAAHDKKAALAKNPNAVVGVDYSSANQLRNVAMRLEYDKTGDVVWETAQQKVNVAETSSVATQKQSYTLHKHVPLISNSQQSSAVSQSPYNLKSSIWSDVTKPAGSYENPHAFVTHSEASKTYAYKYTDHSAAWLPGAKPSWFAFTGPHSGAINTFFRQDGHFNGMNAESVKKQANGMIDAFNSPNLKPLEDWTVVTRGTSGGWELGIPISGSVPFDQLKAQEGKVFRNKCPASTSLATNPAFSSQPIHISYKLPPGFKGLFAMGKSAHPSENEMILPPGVAYKVLEVKKGHGNKTEVLVEVVDVKIPEKFK